MCSILYHRDHRNMLLYCSFNHMHTCTHAYTCMHSHTCRRSELESKELVAEMVASFLLPEVEKQINRKKGVALVCVWGEGGGALEISLCRCPCAFFGLGRS